MFLTMLITPLLHARAESNEGRNDISIQAGGAFFEGDGNLKRDNGTVGIRVGHYLSDRLALEGAVFAAHTQLKDTKASTDVLLPTLGFRYDLGASRFRPFLFVGGGQFRVRPNAGEQFTHFAVDLGIGARYELVKDIALRVDAHDSIDTETGEGTHTALLTAGITFAFDHFCGCDAPQAASPKADDFTKQDSWVLEGVNFETNSDQLTKESTSVLDDAAKVLKSHPNVRVEVQGHTDNIGDPKYNLDLSDRRAVTVKKFLIEKGVATHRLESKGYGETKPIADNNTNEGRAKNRRIEFKVLSR
jgi:OOP family OmpA-OmpF porin